MSERCNCDDDPFHPVYVPCPVHPVRQGPSEPATMKLWLVSKDTWGVSFDIVRAETSEDAIALTKAYRVREVLDLNPEGGAGFLWSYEHSPDTPRD